MNTTIRPSRKYVQRRGIQVLEMLLVLPILVVLIVATVGYARVLLVRSAVVQAATVGAREAGKGGNVLDVAAAVNGVLAAQGLTIADTPGSGAKVVVADSGSGATEYGDAQLTLAAWPVTDPNEVRVTVCVRIPGSNPLTAAIYGDRLWSAAAVLKEGAGIDNVAGNYGTLMIQSN